MCIYQFKKNSINQNFHVYVLYWILFYGVVASCNSLRLCSTHALKTCSTSLCIFLGASSIRWVYCLSLIADSRQKSILCSWVSPLGARVGYYAAAWILVALRRDTQNRVSLSSCSEISSVTQGSAVSPTHKPLSWSCLRGKYFLLHGVVKGVAYAEWENSSKGCSSQQLFTFQNSSFTFLPPLFYDHRMVHAYCS